MPEWLVDFTDEAKDDLAGLDKKVERRVIEKIEWFKNNFNKMNHLPLGYDWRGFFKLRIGNWRAVYNIDYLKRKITVHRVEHRDKVYKRFK